MEGLETDRLVLVPLEAEQLEGCLLGPSDAERALGVPICTDTVTEPAREAIRVKLRRVAVTPSAQLRWHTYWLIRVKADGMGIGLIGFKGAPTSQGVVEVGYGVAEAYRNRGYTTEAVRALVGWAFAQPGCTTIVADTAEENVASQRVLTKAGLRPCGRSRGMVLWRLDKPGSAIKEPA